MNLKSFRLATALAAAALLLAACGTGGTDPDPDPGPGPGPGQRDTIAGSVFAAPASNLHDVRLNLCAAGNDCSNPANVIAERMINTGTSQAYFEFTGLPEGSYSLYASAPTATPTSPPSRFVASRNYVQTGTDNVRLQLEFVVADPQNGMSALSGVLYMPGGRGTTASGGEAQLVQGTGEPVSTVSLSAQTVPEGLLLSNDRSLNRSGQAAAVPGEIVVTFEPDLLFSQATLGTLSVDGIRLQHVEGTAGGHHLYDAGELDLDSTLELAERLRTQPGVRTAAPNWIVHSFVTPNDPLYELQWHYETINLPQAWEISSRSQNVTVAVLDTGSIDHDDLRFTGGYNFVSEGAGRGPDPRDPGEGTDYHGAHVAGTIGAVTNNSLGVAGVSWDVTLVPVRVLGRNGNGTSFDMLDGIRWAAGDNVSGAPVNPNPAKVLNLSLGASLGATCRDVLGGDDSLFTDLAARGIITVVAAGNDNVNTNGVFPANCPSVITVGATGTGTQRAPYSNYGAEVDVMAPGGDLNASFSQGGRSYPYGVLSTVRDGSGASMYQFSQGTSMATPHVSGLVALMLSVEPGLTFPEVVQLLRDNTSTSVCGNGCGAGLIDAASTLASISTGAPPPPPPSEPPPPPPAREAATYLLLNTCSDPDCTGPTSPRQYVAFGDVPPGGVRYIVENLLPGTFELEAYLDLDGSTNPATETFIIDAEDPYDRYAPLLLEPNRTTQGVDLHLERPISR